MKLARWRLPSLTSLLITGLLLGALAPRSTGAPGSESSAQKDESSRIRELLAEIRDGADSPAEPPFRALSRLENQAGLDALERAFGLTRKKDGYAMLFRAVQRYAGLDELGEAAFRFTALHASGNEVAAASGAVPTLWAFGERGRQVLRDIAANGRVAAARALAIAGLRSELRRRKDAASLAVLLGGVAVPGSGSRQQVAELIRAFRSPADFAAMGRYLSQRKADPGRCLLLLSAVAGHELDSAEINAGVASLIQRAVDSRDTALQYEGLRAAAVRGCQLDPSRVQRLTQSEDAGVRRAAFIAGLHGEPPPFRARDLASHRDPLARQAAAIGLGRRQRGALPAKEARTLLHGLLKDPDRVVRLEALRALGALRSKSSIPYLIEVLASESGRLRGDARAALAGLIGRDLGLNPGPWQRFWDREGESLRLPSEAEAQGMLAEAAAPKDEGTRARFYGIQIDSDRLTFVVDTSGSMLEKAYTKETRLEVAQRELRKAVLALKDGTLFHVIAFAEVPRSLEKEPLESTAKSRAKTVSAVDKLTAGGGTNVYRALRAAFDVNGVDTIYLVSDGDPTVGKIVDIEALRREIARWNSTRGLVLHCIAVGQPHELLKNLAEDHGGSYRIVQ